MPNCISPVQIKRPGCAPVYVPCSKCYVCKNKRVASWIYRLKQHARLPHLAYFVTLTYNTDHVPITKNGFKTVRQKDLQNFFKKLRRLNKGNKISYYAASEYGTQTKRPHYHIILFGACDNTITQAWTSDTRGGKCSEALGDIYFGTVEGGSIGYVLKYICKPPEQKRHNRDDREPTRSYMSKGIGANYLTQRMVNYHRSDLPNRVCVQEGDQKISMPKYYKDRIYNSEQKGWLKGFFEHQAPLLDQMTRNDFPELTNYEYEQMRSEQHKQATKKYITDSQKNRD